jgi:hypothetical protein
LERKVLEGAKIIALQSIHLSYEDCNDDFVSKEGLNEYPNVNGEYPGGKVE